MDNALIQRAESGDRDAMLELASLYLNDKHAISLTESTKWADKLAETGNPNGCFLSMLYHAILAMAAESCSIYQDEFNEWDICANRAMKLLKGYQNKQVFLEDEHFDTCLHYCEDALYGMSLAAYSWVSANQSSPNTEVIDSILERLEGADTSRCKTLIAQCYLDLHDHERAFPLLCDVMNDHDYLSSQKRLPEQIVFSSAMFGLAAMYRYGLAGVVKQNIDTAHDVLVTAVSSVDDSDVKKALQNELNRYQKKLFGGYKYI